MSLELGAVALAAQRGQPDQLTRLERLVDKMNAFHSFEDYRRSDVRFHVTIAEAASAPRILAAMTAVQAEASAIIAFVAHPPTVLSHANDEHRALTEALRDRDVEAATRLMRRHLEGTERIIAALQFAS
jgi:DNA-binding FadR family transcriptional regulator